MTKKSGLADSPFFAQQVEPIAPPSSESPLDGQALTPLPTHRSPSLQAEQASRKAQAKFVSRKSKTKKASSHDVMTSRRHDTTTSINHDITISCSQATIVKLRSAVKQIGKEPTTCRITLEEKKILKGVEFEYSTRDIKTSANEILRIAMNIIIGDYQENGEASVLDKILKALKE